MSIAAVYCLCADVTTNGIFVDSKYFHTSILLNLQQENFRWLNKVRTLVKSAYQKIYFSYFSIKVYVVGTQKNRLNETVLLST